jgi:tetratricopeptide (TPR) repeat protein
MAFDLAALEAELKRDPGSRRFGDLAREYQRLGKLEEAQELCEKGLVRYPNQWQARLLLTQIYLAKGKLSQAREAVDRILMALPDHVAANHLAGDIYYALEDRPRALRHYQIVELFEPGRPGVGEKIAELTSPAPAAAAQPTGNFMPGAEPSVLSASPPSEQPAKAPVLHDQPASKMESSLPSAAEVSESQGNEASPKQEAEVHDLGGTIKMASWGGTIANETPPAQEEPLFQEPAFGTETPSNEPPAELPGPAEERDILFGGGSLAATDADVPPAGQEVSSGKAEHAELLDALEENGERPPLGGVKAGEQAPSGDENLVGLNTTTLAELYARQGFPEKAIEIYQRILLANPDNEDVKQRVRALMRRIDGDAPEMPEVRQEDVRMAVRQRRVKLLEEWLRRVRYERHV